MKIATWNVNSIRVRTERLLAWLTRHQPDVLCLQELKCIDEKVPKAEIEALGYQVAVFGQPTYNGVAILSKRPIDESTRIEMPGPAPEVTHARALRARVAGIDIYSLYVPNGSEVSSDKYLFKQRWLDALHALVASEKKANKSMLLCGDFNIAPSDDDVANPEAWASSVLCDEQVRSRFSRLIELGFIDSFRALKPDAREYSWWDYRQLGFVKNDGLRIDHILASDDLKARLVDASIDRDERKGKQPSDHAPVVLDLSE